MIYPLIFEPIYKKTIWGGDRIARLLGRGDPREIIGESWDIVCGAGEMSVIANGIYAGKKFIDLINSNKESYLGKELAESDNFPLLVKIIDAQDNLSVQVHPTDEYAREYEAGRSGKSEMWYILEAPEDGELIVGVKPGITRDALKEALINGDIGDCFGRLRVEVGDIISIPAGLVHALTKGCMVAEIQQSSDITYRLYDYGRLGIDGKPRELHTDKALDVIDFIGKYNEANITGTEREEKLCTITHYNIGDYLNADKYVINDVYTEVSDENLFCIFTCVAGDCEIQSNKYCMDIKKGESVFIPAALGEYTFKGECTLIKSYVPGSEKGI